MADSAAGDLDRWPSRCAGCGGALSDERDGRWCPRDGCRAARCPLCGAHYARPCAHVLARRLEALGRWAVDPFHAVELPVVTWRGSGGVEWSAAQYRRAFGGLFPLLEYYYRPPTSVLCEVGLFDALAERLAAPVGVLVTPATLASGAAIEAQTWLTPDPRAARWALLASVEALGRAFARLARLPPEGRPDPYRDPGPVRRDSRGAWVNPRSRVCARRCRTSRRWRPAEPPDD